MQIQDGVDLTRGHNNTVYVTSTKRNKINDRRMRYGLTNIGYLQNSVVYPKNTVDLNTFMDIMKKQNTFQE